MQTPLNTLIEMFATSKQIEGKSARTITWYRQTLTRFSGFTENPPLKELSLDQARSFIASLQNQTSRYNGHPLRPEEEGGLSSSTIHGYVRSLKSFSSWLYEEGYTSHNLLAKIKRPKVSKPVIEILSDTEIEKIISAINPNCFLGSRLYVIILLLLDTGIRANELCTLTTENTFMDESYIKVTGKGNKERIIPFGATTKKALIRYLNTFRPESDAKELILSTDGSSLTYFGLFHAIRRLGEKIGIERLHPHLFRHTFAVKYLMNGGDLMSLRLMLGHTDISVTQIYLSLAESHIQVQHNRFSPVDRIKVTPKRHRAKGG